MRWPGMGRHQRGGEKGILLTAPGAPTDGVTRRDH